MKPFARQSLETAVQQLFAVPREDVADVLAELEPRVCRGGDWLFRQGEAGDALYLLARGRMEVWISQEPSAGSPEQLVAEVGPGETIGEIGLLTGSARSASIRAVRDSLLLRMDTATFDRLARERPRLIRGIAGGIASRLRDRTAGDTRERRRYRTVALLPLGETVHTESLADDLAGAIGPGGPAIVLSPSRLGARAVLFRLPDDIYLSNNDYYTPFDITPDDQHFVMASILRRRGGTDASYVLVENWFEEVKAKVDGQ